MLNLSVVIGHTLLLGFVIIHTHTVQMNFLDHTGFVFAKLLVKHHTLTVEMSLLPHFISIKFKHTTRLEYIVIVLVSLIYFFIESEKFRHKELVHVCVY